MQIVKYQTEGEAQIIIAKKMAEGMTLTHISNVTEGNFLGFMENPSQPPTPIEVRLEEMETKLDSIIIKQDEIKAVQIAAKSIEII